MLSSSEKRFDVGIIGGGVLGATIAFWISELYSCRVGLFEKEENIALHTSSRNTGVIHRPFYLDPMKKKIFARSAQRSYFLWKRIALKYGLPWKEVGTLEVALEDGQVKTLEKYAKWAELNGMQSGEAELLSPDQVRELEPLVSSHGAIHSKTDTSVDFGKFSRFVFEFAKDNGVKFFAKSKVRSVEETPDGVRLDFGKNEIAGCRFLINCAGGTSLDFAHQLDLAKEYTDLHFRGEYWQIEDAFASKISRNIYSVAKFPEFPFLDPHFIVRVDGRREIGPNAVLVFEPDTYKGLSNSKLEILGKIFERPVMPKLKLFTSQRFLSLVLNEWKSSISKSAMCERARQFIPSLDVTMLRTRGLSGVRSSLVGRDGFVPEAMGIWGSRSYHILNFNSPGATGAPAFSAYVVKELGEKGVFDGFGKKEKGEHMEIWKFEEALS